jgi:serine/threonine protein kinase
MNDASRQGGADQLVGVVLPGDWFVRERVIRDEGPSEQARSSCYVATNPAGEYAFVKAYDFRHEEVHRDTERLEYMVREFNNERRVHQYCKDEKLSRVTRIFDSGDLVLGGSVVHYLICEYAPRSLKQVHPPGDLSIKASERLRGLRKVAAGVAQMHTVGVAHQDIKPGNAVEFDNREIKVTDLGSSSCAHLPPPPHDAESYCGQPGYAPYELLYDDTDGTWYKRRIGCDMFLLGNLAFTSFVGYSLSYLVLHTMPAELRHTVFAGKYEDVLPYLVESHFDMVPAALKGVVPPIIEEEFVRIVLSMCHPNPFERGHALNRAGKGGQFGLERYISAFELMAIKCERYERAAA